MVDVASGYVRLFAKLQVQIRRWIIYTVIASPTHVLPVQTTAQVWIDSVGGGAQDIRRQWTRPLKQWELRVPGQAERIDPLGGLLDYAQGDIPIWFDGAAAIEVTEPILIFVGNNSTTDISLPHRYVFVSSTVIYLNGGAINTWQPLGGDGIVMDKIRMSTAPGQYAQIRAKYKRKCKVVVSTDTIERNRAFRDFNAKQSIYEQVFTLNEVPN